MTKRGWLQLCMGLCIGGFLQRRCPTLEWIIVVATTPFVVWMNFIRSDTANPEGK